MQKRPILSIVIPTRNRYEYLFELIGSIAQSHSIELGLVELIIVEDLSENPYDYGRILLKFRRSFQSIVINQNKTRMGASGSRNIGLRLAKADIVLFIDDDNIVDEDFVSSLFNVEKRQQFAMLGGITFYFKSRRIQYVAWKVFLDKASVLSGKMTLHFPSVEGDEAVIEADYVPNAFMVRKDEALKIGGFDETFVVYFEDTDFGMRMKRFGKVGIVKAAHIFHKGEPDYRLRPDKESLIVRNYIAFVNKYDRQLVPYAYIGALKMALDYSAKCILKGEIRNLYRFTKLYLFER